MLIHHSKTEDGKYNIALIGRLTKDAQYSETAQKKIPKVSFSVVYGEKKYMNCVALGRGSLVKLCACLEKGDSVFLAGVWSTREFTKKDGQKDTWSEVNVEFLTVQSEPNIPVNGQQEQQDNIPLQQNQNNKIDPLDTISQEMIELEDDGELPF